MRFLVPLLGAGLVLSSCGEPASPSKAEPKTASEPQPAAGYTPPAVVARMVGKMTPPVNAPISRAFVPGAGVARPTGIEYAPAPGTPVVAAADGTVKLVSEAGKSVIIAHANGLYTGITPLDNFQVHEGQTVTAGTTLGTFAPIKTQPALNFYVSVPGKSRTFGVDANTAEADPTIYLAR